MAIFESYSIGPLLKYWGLAILQYRLRFASIVTSKYDPKLLPEIREFSFAMGIFVAATVIVQRELLNRNKSPLCCVNLNVGLCPTPQGFLRHVANLSKWMESLGFYSDVI